MRFEVVAAFTVGILLPVLETCRRGLGHWRVDSTTMLEDYLAGMLLLFAATTSIRGKRNARLWMVFGWSLVTGMLCMSPVKHIELALRGAEMEPHYELVILVKLLLGAVCTTALVLSFKHARTRENGSTQIASR